MASPVRLIASCTLPENENSVSLGKRKQWEIVYEELWKLSENEGKGEEYLVMKGMGQEGVVKEIREGF